MLQLDIAKTADLIQETLRDADGGELFLELLSREIITLEDGIISDVNLVSNSGFGLRAFYGDKTIFTHSPEITDVKMKEAVDFINENKSTNKCLNYEIENCRTYRSLYQNINILDKNAFHTIRKVNTLQEIYNYILKKNSRIKKVRITLTSEVQKVQIIKKNAQIIDDLRPLCRLNILVIISDNGNLEQGYYGTGGRFSCNELFKDWEYAADRAVSQAEVNLKAAPAPAGEMEVVLKSGWPGIILHEAVGHGLESDFNRKGTSAFSNLMGKSVANKNVSVIDDGTIKNRRGSINFDDEGTASSHNVLIENGRLVNYMYDLMNAKIMKKTPTGNGRRESYKFIPMPRMTNTYMLPGDYEAEEIIASVKHGIYLVSFSGGQVDITSGEFVFSASEGYLISNGKVTEPIKGATLIGKGTEVLHKISMIGNDFKLDSGIGTCGKDGQNIPVGVGQPTIKIDKITVGGTQA